MEENFSNQNLPASSDNTLWQIFENRKQEVQKARDQWLYLFIANILALFAIAIFIFISLSNGTSFAIAALLEFGVALPLAYSAIFFHAQHSKTREYLEEYAFKALVARSLDTCRKILKEDIGEKIDAVEEKKYLDFVIGSMKNLYTPPREIISKHPVRNEDEIKVGVVEKLGDVFKKFIPKI